MDRINILMRTFLNILTVAIWLFVLSYFSNMLGVPKNGYYLVTVVPLGFGGMFLINYLFNRNKRKL